MELISLDYARETAISCWLCFSFDWISWSLVSDRVISDEKASKRSFHALSILAFHDDPSIKHISIRNARPKELKYSGFTPYFWCLAPKPLTNSRRLSKSGPMNEKTSSNMLIIRWPWISSAMLAIAPLPEVLPCMPKTFLASGSISNNLWYSASQTVVRCVATNKVHWPTTPSLTYLKIMLMPNCSKLSQCSLTLFHVSITVLMVWKVKSWIAICFVFDEVKLVDLGVHWVVLWWMKERTSEKCEKHRV